MPTKKRVNKNTRILNHDISWYVDVKSVTELDECSIEHIETCIKDGISQGDLYISYGKNGVKTANGWWNIINWRDIACELYNAFGNKEREQKAKERFEER